VAKFRIHMSRAVLLISIAKVWDNVW